MTPLAVLFAWCAAAAAGPDEPEADPQADVTVAVARLPLPAGKKLTWDDLTTVKLPPALVPPTAIVLGTELVGKTLTHPVAQQSPIVAQRLEGVAVPVVEAAEVLEATVTVERDLGVAAALVQAGDTVGFVRPGRSACVVAWAQVLARGAPVTLEVPAEQAAGLQRERDAVLIVPGPEAQRPALGPCGGTP
jgi:Flp pilus assembly protein CpaB